MTAAALLAAFAGGVLVGLRMGAHWRQRLRAALRAASAEVVKFNSSANRDDLAEVGPISGEHQAVDEETAGVELRCARCGSGVAFRDCGACEGDRGLLDPESWHTCIACEGQGQIAYCTAPAGWCFANPMEGRWDTPMSAIEEVHPDPAPAVERYDAQREEGFPLCSWCEALATTRIDLPGGKDLPSCEAHVQAARLGEVSVADAYPDNEATLYDKRLG